MSDYLGRLRDQLVDTSRVLHSRPARRRFAAFPLTAALVLGVAGTAAGGTYLALSNSSIAPFAASDVAPEQRVAPGTSRVQTLRAADPQRGLLPWTIRVSRSETGLQCSTVGQVEGEAFGLVGLDGQFREVPESNADACGQPDTLLGTRIFAAKRSRDVRTVLYGVAGPELERVTVALAGGAPRTVPHAPDGAFVFVLGRYPEDARPTVTLRMKDGTTRRHTFPSADGFVVADPFGGRAWRLTSFGFGVSVQPGKRPPKPPRLQKGCVNFATARSLPDEPNVSSPPVCGLQPGRRGVKHDVVYFDTRRLSGRGPSRNFMAGNWNGHPPRVAVWGAARDHKRIVVRAGRFRAQLKPLANGTFLVLLPPSTDPSSVTVAVDGKQYGHTHGTVEPPEGAR